MASRKIRVQSTYVSDTELTVIMDADGEPLHICDCKAMIAETLGDNPGSYIATGEERARELDFLELSRA